MMTFLSRCSTTLTTLFLVQVLLSPPHISATTDTPVLDNDGNPIETTSQYYIIPFPSPVGFPTGLGLTLRPGQNPSPFTCPQFVYQTHPDQIYGPLPVKFIPTDPAQKNITLSTDLKISFVSSHLTCPAVWSLTADPETARIYVSTGVWTRNWKVKQGTMLNALFKIKTTTAFGYNLYKITYSPDPSQLALGDLALFQENGTDWLGLSFDALEEALPVYFRKRKFD